MSSDRSFLAPSADANVTTEIEIKRSRFICLLRRADSEEQARAHVRDARSAFPDARHHCSAFIIHVDGAQPIERSSDDGEPSGTAGKPMLDILRGSGLQNVCAIVVRYFGGTKLGTGGLVRAYSDSVSEALDNVTIARRRRSLQFEIPIPIADVGRAEAFLRASGFHIVETVYGEVARVVIVANDDEVGRLEAAVAEVTKGEGDILEAGQIWFEEPVASI